MTDNFETFKQYIQVSEPDFDYNNDKFFSVEILKRRKDNSEIHGDTHTIKVYYINKIADFDFLRDEIIKLCEVFHARAYVSVNCKSYEAITKANMVELATRIANNDYKKSYSIFNSCTAKYIDGKKKKWLIDVDAEDAIKFGMSIAKLTDKIKDIIEKQCSPFRDIITVFPSCSGNHIITSPFNTEQFCAAINDVFDKPRSLIKKNNSTILYSVK